MTASIVERVARAIWPDAQIDYVGKEQAERQATAALSVICEVLREADPELAQIVTKCWRAGDSDEECLRAIATHLDQRTE